MRALASNSESKALRAVVKYCTVVGRNKVTSAIRRMVRVPYNLVNASTCEKSIIKLNAKTTFGIASGNAPKV